MSRPRDLHTIEGWERVEGCSSPLGATWVESEAAWNFAVFSRHATAMTLLLYGREDPVHPVFELRLDPIVNKSSRIWHCFVKQAEAPEAVHYAWRAEGPFDRVHGHHFHPEKVLLDPYAAEVYFPPDFSRLAACGTDANDGQAVLGVLPRASEPFDWPDVSPPRHTHAAVVYELELKGFKALANSGAA